MCLLALCFLQRNIYLGLLPFFLVWLFVFLMLSFMNAYNQFSSVAQLSDFLRPHELQHTRPPLSITNPRSSPRLMSIEPVMPSSYLILCCPLLLLPPIPPRIRVSSNESTLHMRWPNIGISASGSVLPINIQDWSPLGWTGWISLQSKGLSRVFPNTTAQNHQIVSTQLSSQSNCHIHT